MKSTANIKTETTQDLFISTENIFPLSQRPPEDFSEVIFSSFRLWECVSCSQRSLGVSWAS